MNPAPHGIDNLVASKTLIKPRIGRIKQIFKKNTNPWKSVKSVVAVLNTKGGVG